MTFMLENSGMLNGTFTSCVLFYVPSDMLYLTLLSLILDFKVFFFLRFIILSVDQISHKHDIPVLMVYQ